MFRVTMLQYWMALYRYSHSFRLRTTAIVSFPLLLLLCMIIGSSYPVAFSSAQEAPSLNQNDCRDDVSIDNHSQSRFNIMDSKLERKVIVEEDPSTLLDAFGELAKDIVTHHIIPPTDSECRWDWRYFRCEPYCTCMFQFISGDYHFGRSCRLRSPQNYPQPNSNEYLHNYKESFLPEGCHLPPNSWYTKAFASSRTALHRGREKLHELERQVKEVATTYRSELYDNICEDHHNINSIFDDTDATSGNVNESDLKSKIGKAIPAMAKRIRKAACSSIPSSAED